MNKKTLFWILAIVLGIPAVIYALCLWIGYRIGDVVIAIFGLAPK